MGLHAQTSMDEVRISLQVKGCNGHGGISSNISGCDLKLKTVTAFPSTCPATAAAADAAAAAVPSGSVAAGKKLDFSDVFLRFCAF